MQLDSNTKDFNLTVYILNFTLPSTEFFYISDFNEIYLCFIYKSDILIFKNVWINFILISILETRKHFPRKLWLEKESSRSFHYLDFVARRLEFQGGLWFSSLEFHPLNLILQLYLVNHLQNLQINLPIVVL